MRNYRQNHRSFYNHTHRHQRQQRSHNPLNVPRRRRNHNYFRDDRRVNDSSSDQDDGSYSVSTDHYQNIASQLQDEYLRDEYLSALLIRSSIDSLNRLISNNPVSYYGYTGYDDDDIDYMTNQLTDVEMDSSFFTMYDYIRDSDLDEGDEEDEDEDVDDVDVLKYLTIRTHYGDPKVIVGDVAESSEMCAICQSEFEHEDNIGTLPQCGHEYHTSCIKKWLSKKKDCPICRSSVFPSQENGC